MKNVLSRISRAYNDSLANQPETPNKSRLYYNIYNILKNLIVNNDIPAKTIMPATRILAAELKVSRSTIVKSYELLVVEGLLDSVSGSGHTVKQIALAKNQAIPTDIFNDIYPDISETAKSFTRNITLINSNDDKGIPFTPGLPPLDCFPVNQWKNLTNLYWKHIKASALSYSASSGTEQLKKTLASYLNFTRNIKCDPRQIIIVSGSVQSLYILGNVVLNPGDHMTIENPTFPNVISIFKGLRSKVHTIDIDEEGLSVSGLIQSGHLQSKLIHTVPSCHYPTGIKMSLNRRLQLLDWANKNKAIIIENDYEHEINNFKDSLPALFSLDKQERTVFLGTFNRLLHPSIRVGYMIVPFYLLDAVEAVMKHSHRFVPSSIQVVLSQFIERNYLYNHVRNVIEVAREREAIFSETFRNYFNDSLLLHPNVTRSLHFLIDLPASIDDKKLINHFLQQNIVIHPYSKCFAGEDYKSGMILGYTPVKSVVIRQKIQLMEELYRDYF